MTWCYRELETFDPALLVALLPTFVWKSEYKNSYSLGCLRAEIHAASQEQMAAIYKLANSYGPSSRGDLRKVPPNGAITPHRDMNVGKDERRIHWPLVSHPDIKMIWPEEGVELHLVPGQVYEVNPHQLHTIVNPTSVDRVHLVLDFKTYRPPLSGNED